MKTCVADYGGIDVFGDFDEWGDTLSIRMKHQSQNLPPCNEDELEQLPEPKRISVDKLQETVNIESLSEYASKESEKNNEKL